MSTMLAPVLRDRAELFALLSIWSERGWLRELDRALVQLFAELDPQASPLLLLGAAAETAQAVGQQQIAVDDLERAVALDDAARADLVAAIAAAEKRAG